jgi:NADPH:quinone reductase-like Zn-dependent oxidoreductase
MNRISRMDKTFETQTAKACRIHEFGGSDRMSFDDIPVPKPGPGEVLMRVKSAGVGPWDAWIRAGKSALPQPLPLTLGADLAGVVAGTGPGVAAFQTSEAVFGVTNARFTGAYAEYAIASSSMIARIPSGMTFDNAASVPVVAATAWQALFDHARLVRGQTVLIHGAAGSVGSFAVQMAVEAGVGVIATASPGDAAALRAFGAERVLDYRVTPFWEAVTSVDAVIDLVGGEVQTRSFEVLKAGGALVSAVSPPDQLLAAHYGVTAVFFLVDVNTALLERILAMIQSCALSTSVGTILPLAAARIAHDMVEGHRPHPRGKIILHVAD